MSVNSQVDWDMAAVKHCNLMLMVSDGVNHKQLGNYLQRISVGSGEPVAISLSYFVLERTKRV
jgi:hypothetical protein